MKTSAFTQYANYPPSVLVVASDDAQSHMLKQWLENKGCQTFEINPQLVNPITTIYQQYFDLVVLDIEAIDTVVSEVITRLRTDPEFADTPVVIMSRKSQITNILKELAKRPFYFILKDNSAKEILLQIIQQIHYMTYRYALVGYA